MFPTLFKGMLSKTVTKQTGTFWKDFFEQAAVDEANDRMETQVNTRPSLGGGAATLLRKYIKPDDGKVNGTVTPHFTPQKTHPPVTIQPTEPGGKPSIGGVEKMKMNVFKFYQFDTMRWTARNRLFALAVTNIMTTYGHDLAFANVLIAMARRRIYSMTEEQALAELAALREAENRQYA